MEEWTHDHGDNAVDAEGRRLTEAALTAHKAGKNRAQIVTRRPSRRRRPFATLASYGERRYVHWRDPCWDVKIARD